jgi:hypothetical protein
MYTARLRADKMNALKTKDTVKNKARKNVTSYLYVCIITNYYYLSRSAPLHRLLRPHFFLINK